MSHRMDWEDRSPEELNRVARYQRWLIASVVVQLLVCVAFFTLPAFDGKEVGERFNALWLRIIVCLSSFGGIYTFLLYWIDRRSTFAFVLGGVAAVPVVGVFAQLLVNTRATVLLERHGVRVGLFGANLAELPTGVEIVDFDADW